jgi:aspartyl/asparaginyl beta-hydroxylase (cupin superfamily)
MGTYSKITMTGAVAANDVMTDGMDIANDTTDATATDKGAPAMPAAAPLAAAVPRRPLIIRWGKRLRRTVDRIVAAASLVPNDPVLDARAFAFTAILRDNWQAIRDEALAVTRETDAVPSLNEISPDHARIAPAGLWRSFFLIGYGARIEDNLARCPKTAAVLAQVPGLNSGFFSILKPGTHIPEHRGVTKGLLTCHLGLKVPANGSVRMNVGPETVGWAEGEVLLFDDTWQHEVWNDSDETRIVLLVQFERPLRQPGRALARAFLGGIRRSAFVKEAVDNIARWEDSLRRVEAAAN